MRVAEVGTRESELACAQSVDRRRLHLHVSQRSVWNSCHCLLLLHKILQRGRYRFSTAVSQPGCELFMFGGAVTTRLGFYRVLHANFSTMRVPERKQRMRKHI